jgi:hypothetical protein
MSQVERFAGLADAAVAGLDTRRFLRALIPVFCDGMGPEKQTPDAESLSDKWARGRGGVA